MIVQTDLAFSSSMTHHMLPPAAHALTRAEWRANLSLASIFGLRMLGICGLTQAALKFVYGQASDGFGRKPVILAGLLVFAACSTVVALAR